jgi:hypothetical protein
VILDQDPWSGLSGWCVEISGASVGSAMTDSEGNYTFSGTAGGSYLVCLVVPDGWVQTKPNSGTLCPSGNYGRSFSVGDGQTASLVNFRAVPE